MYRHRGGNAYDKHGKYSHDSVVPSLDRHDDSASMQYLDSSEYHSADEYFDDVNEYPTQNDYQEESYGNVVDDGYDQPNEMSLPNQSAQRRIFYNDRAEYHDQANHYSAISRQRRPQSIQRYAQEGPSSLQTRLDSFAAPTRHRAVAPPINDDEVMNDAIQAAPDTSPTPNRTFNAQPAHLAPAALPVHLEFTAPADFAPMETGRGTSGQHCEANGRS
jgi:hypothetical protein